MCRMPCQTFRVKARGEAIAFKEGKTLGVPPVASIDTESDRDLIALPIPGNDDAMKAIEIILKELADAIIEGKTIRPEAKGEEPGQGPRRRSARSPYRAEEAGAPGAPGAAPAAPGVDIPAPSPSAPVENV